jgi:hypothetical protein
MPTTSHRALADSYAAALAAQLAHVVIDAAAALAEPAHRGAERDRAIARLRPLVDTLAGFAIGAAIAPVIACARRFGAPADQLGLARAIGDATRTYDGRARGDAVLTPASVIDDAHRRPLVGELATQLHARLLAGAGELRGFVLALLAPVPADRLDAVAYALRTDFAALVGERFAAQLRHGWAAYTAELARTDTPAIDEDRSRALWQHWRLRVRGERPAAAETLDRGEFILRVA